MTFRGAAILVEAVPAAFFSARILNQCCQHFFFFAIKISLKIARSVLILGTGEQNGR